MLNNRKIQTKQIKLQDSHSFYFNKNLEYNKKYKFVVEGSSTINELDFETTLNLKAPFIKPKNPDLFSPIFIRIFSLKKKVKNARLYITGLGLYRAYINDNKVGNAYLTPGFNDYDYYLRYQTYDITKLLKENNIIEVHMGDGWYKGRFGFGMKGNNIFGDEYKLCLHILIENIDGTFENILSDESWKIKPSNEISNSIYDGEEVDYTLPEKPFEDVIITKEKYNLIPDFGSLIVEKEKLHPILLVSPNGENILDFNQNMVGFVRFKGNLEKNKEIKMTHGEILQNNSLYTKNLGSAKQIAKYKGDGKNRVYEPKFTYFGFRYVLVEGLTKIDPNDFEGVVIYTNLERTLECKTDNNKINKLIQNVVWGQRGNFLDIPTDCPQRAERLGWTADTQVFLNTACYNMDSYIFYKKYMNDLRGDQTLYYDGDIPAFSPSLQHLAMNGGAVWADAATIIPWNFYMNYGDKYLLNYFYPLMKDYVETLIKKDIDQGNKNLILEGFTHGDWLALDRVNKKSNFGGTDHGFILSIYYFHSVEIIASAAKELGKSKDYNKYNDLKNKIFNSILNQFFDNNGRLKLNTQTSYVLCLHYKIYKNKDILIQDFSQRLKKDLYQLKTGFTGTPLLLLSLFDNNMDNYAYRLLYNEEFPGWLYAINLGATTIWERWDSLLENGTINNYPMNSLNHYSYGSVCEAIYSRIAGLTNKSPGWKKVLIQPHLNYRMKRIDFSYQSISGTYEISWRWIDTRFNMVVTIPYGCEAEIILPNKISHEVKGGRYTYECDIDRNIYNPFSIDAPIKDIMKNNKASNLIKELLPKIYKQISNKTSGIETHTIREIYSLPPYNYSLDILKKFNENVTQIKP